MKDLRMLIWLTQFGLSVIFPLVGYLLLGIWLNNRFELGTWTIIAGLALGMVSAARGFRDSIKAMERMSGQKQSQDPPSVSFNQHD